jgi:hypothetical protein
MYRPNKGMSTPWGTCQNKTVLGRGVFTVSTAGHGGLAVSRALALRVLTPKALKHAIGTKGYYWFEEDCAICLALVDSSHVLDLFCNVLQRNKAKTHLEAINSVERWYPDYFEAAKQINQINDNFTEVNFMRGVCNES